MNGQVVIWDIGEVTEKFMVKECVWDHSVVMSKQTDKLHIEDGFIPIMYWSAESVIAEYVLFVFVFIRVRWDRAVLTCGYKIT